MNITTTAINGIDQLAGGAASERFTAAMEQVLENIYDPNTNPKSVRSITLKVSIRPNEDRETAKLSISTTATLAPQVSIEIPIVMGRDGDRVVASEITKQLAGQIDIEGNETHKNLTVLGGLK